MDAESLQTAAYEETIRILTAQISRRNALITELCDALEDWCKGLDGVTVAASDKALIQRGREAAK